MGELDDHGGERGDLALQVSLLGFKLLDLVLGIVQPLLECLLVWDQWAAAGLRLEVR